MSDADYQRGRDAAKKEVASWTAEDAVKYLEECAKRGVLTGRSEHDRGFMEVVHERAAGVVYDPHDLAKARTREEVTERLGDALDALQQLKLDRQAKKAEPAKVAAAIATLDLAAAIDDAGAYIDQERRHGPVGWINAVDHLVGIHGYDKSVAETAASKAFEARRGPVGPARSTATIMVRVDLEHASDAVLVEMRRLLERIARVCAEMTAEGTATMVRGVIATTESVPE